MLWVAVVLGTLLLTPSLVAEDRRVGHLDFLLVTDLRAREIVCGRLAARLAEVLGFALIPIPVLAALPLLGGVEPAAIAVSLALLASTAFLTAALGTLASVQAEGPRAAIVVLWGSVIAYTVVSAVCGPGVVASSLSPHGAFGAMVRPGRTRPRRGRWHGRWRRLNWGSACR